MIDDLDALADQKNESDQQVQTEDSDVAPVSPYADAPT